MKYELIAPRDKGLSIVEQVFKNRGITDINHYLNTTDKDLCNPLLLDNMREGAKMLIAHISQDHGIYLQVDSDCDGYTSSALLLNYLNRLFPSFVQNRVTYAMHDGKQHGIDVTQIPAGTKLVIAPDSSSNEYELHQALSEKGIDILVLDHHEAPSVSQYACVINNQLSEYPTKSLSGVGIVYKFCCYIDELLGANHADDFVDLAALGIIADVMSLKDYETKRVIDKGIANIRNPFFKGMTIKNEYSIGSEVTPFGIAWYVAPYVNAVTRSGTIEEKLLIFESMLEFKAYEEIPSTKRGCKGQMETRVEQAVRTCLNIKNRQTKARDSYLETVEKQIVDRGLLNHQVILVQNDGPATTLSGLVANQLMGKYKKPILILTATKHDGETSWEGSCRAPLLPSIGSCKDFYQASGLVEYCEGHASAFGIGIKDYNIQAFLSYCDENLKDLDLSPIHKVDTIIPASELDYTEFESLMSFGNIWGQGVEEPLIAIENLKVTKDNIILMKGTTLKIIQDNLPMIKFKSNEQEYETLRSSQGVVTINAIVTCKKNEWMGRISPQLYIEDYEIVDRMEYYF